MFPFLTCNFLSFQSQLWHNTCPTAQQGDEVRIAQGSNMTQIHGLKPSCKGQVSIKSSPEGTLCCGLDFSFKGEPAHSEVRVLSPTSQQGLFSVTWLHHVERWSLRQQCRTCFYSLNSQSPKISRLTVQQERRNLFIWPISSHCFLLLS